MEGFIDTLISRRLDANAAADDIFAISIEAWQGAGAAAARDSLKALLIRTGKVRDNLEVFLQATSTAQDGIGDVETLVLEAQSRADHYGFIIAEDGSEVTDPQFDNWWEKLSGRIAAGQSSQFAMELAERERALDDCALAVSDALRRAVEVDQAFCEALGTIAEDMVTSEMAEGSGPLPGLPSANPSTEEAAIWWDSLTAEEQQEYIASHPELIGAMDGVDGWARDEANRGLLERDLEQAQERWDNGDRSAGLALEISELEALDRALKPADGEVRQLLLYTPATGEDGNYHMHAAVSIGDVDAADYVSTFVPGMTTTVGSSVEGYTADMHNLNMIAQGKLDVMGRDERVATVAWLGYDAPGNPAQSQLVDSMDDVNPGDFPLIIPQGGGMGYDYQEPLIYSVDSSIFTPERAEQGGESLTSFVEGLHDNRTYGSGGVASPYHSVLGHSYGSTSSSYGVADVRPGTVDGYAAFGTPGVDGGAWNMNVRNNYVMNYDNEEIIRYLNKPFQWISGIHDVGALGLDPSKDPGFTTLYPGQAEDGLAHTQYLNDQSRSQSELADVVIDAVEADR